MIGDNTVLPVDIVLAPDSGDLSKTGVCCINMDATVPESNITAMFETVAALRVGE
jgi:hypothetical protein